MLGAAVGVGVSCVVKLMTSNATEIDAAPRASIEKGIDAMIEATNVWGFRERQLHEETRAETASKQAP